MKVPSTVKTMLVRSTPDVCKQRLLQGNKHVDRVHLFKETLRISRVGNARCHNNTRYVSIVASGLKNTPPAGHEPLFQPQFRAQAILTPVSDPTPTTEKVRSILLHVLWVLQGSPFVLPIKNKFVCIDCLD